ncbi:hypothetical protein OM076_13735 [Solirubrobacter ginsenosidimutans]|uniref:Uncharacterized protein n=1 Tax=Solirubrobacter ginsenosidimutans TaxID=490573 RepID=A0A9X3MRQ3_9ACTN|nr:hypothetical protein [Solirubrobacter ginsenosidimutans]
MNDIAPDPPDELVIEPTKQLGLITTKPHHTIPIGHNTDQAAEPRKRAIRLDHANLSL